MGRGGCVSGELGKHVVGDNEEIQVKRKEEYKCGDVRRMQRNLR